MGLVDYVSRHPFQKAKKVSTYDEEFIVAKLNLVSTSINSLELNNTKPATNLHKLLIKDNPALQITPKIEAHNPALQITPKNEANNKAINLISAPATRVCKHVYYTSPAPRKLASNTNCNLNNLNYVAPASQSPLNTSLAQQNTSKSKQLIQIPNELALAQCEPQIIHSKIPPIRRHSSNIKNHHSKIKLVLFASSHSTIQSCTFKPINSFSSRQSSEIDYVN